MPHPTDQLWIVTDGSVKQNSIGAAMYTIRGDKLFLCGHFSAKLQSHQPSWLHCEVEVLVITVAIEHFSPCLIQSQHNPAFLVNICHSKPCVSRHMKNFARANFQPAPG